MLKNYKILLEPFSLTAYFRSILKISNSFDVFNFLLKKSGLSSNELEGRWDNFDKVFGKEYGNKISALSFATIIEARGKLLSNILKKQDKKNTLIIELASGFTPRGLNFSNNGINNYIETDKKNVIELKQEFYNYLNSIGKKTPKLEIIDVLKKEDFKNIYDLVKLEKLKNNSLKEIIFVSEGLLIYLNKQEQKKIFDNLKYISKLLKNINIKVKYLTIDMPSHENFTNWLVDEGFSLKDHLEVMTKVEPKIIESLHNTENDFLTENSLENIKKYYYDDEIIFSLKTPKLEKYKKIKGLKEKIKTFLKQKILFAWEVEI